jgi:myo-inositol-1(or 4)-monophosphatase
MNYTDTLQTAISISHEAGLIVRQRFPRTALADIGFKSATEPVTETDTIVEGLIVARLQDAFPGHHILAEESGLIVRDGTETDGELASTSLAESIAGGETPMWVIDPVDGTNNFAHGFPHVGISMALLVAGRPVVGVVHDPLRGETFAATAGGGATLDGQPMRVSCVEHLVDAFMATGFPRDRRTAADNNAERFDHLLRRSLGVREFGAAVLDLAYVACGRLDAYWEMRLKPWDVAAGTLLVREAGGRVTDFKGGPDCIFGDSIAASNGHIHGQMLRVIREGAAAPRLDGLAG